MITAFNTAITLIGNSYIHSLVKEIGARYDKLLKDGLGLCRIKIFCGSRSGMPLTIG